MASLTITLPDELSKYIEEQVAAGRGGDASAFIRLLIERDQRIRMSPREAFLTSDGEGIAK